LVGQQPNLLLRASLDQTNFLALGLPLEQGTVVPTSFTTEGDPTPAPPDAPSVLAPPDAQTLPINTDALLVTTPADPTVVSSDIDDQVVVSPTAKSDGTTLLASALPTGAPNEQFLQSGFLPRILDDGTRHADQSASLNGGEGVETNLILPSRANRVDAASGMLAAATSRVEPTSGIIAPVGSGPPFVPVSLPLERLAANQPSGEEVASAIGAVAPLFNAHRAKQPQQLALPEFGIQPNEGGLDEVSDAAQAGAKPIRRLDPLSGQLASTRNAPSRLDQRDGLGMPSNRTNIFQSGMLSVPPLET
jgi:hypothetical protein